MLPHAGTFVALWLLIASTGQVLAGIGSILLRWPQGTNISVCFYGGTPTAREIIANTATEWTEGLGVGFDFGKRDNFHSCETGDSSYDVRVAFNTQNVGHYIGTDARKVPKGKPTINFQGWQDDTPPDARVQVLTNSGTFLDFCTLSKTLR